MSDADILDHEAVVENLVDDAEVAYSNPVGVGFTDHGDAARGPRVVGQQVDRGTDSLLVSSLQRGQGPLGTAGDLDVISPCHVSPSSALTSSQGT